MEAAIRHSAGGTASASASSTGMGDAMLRARFTMYYLVRACHDAACCSRPPMQPPPSTRCSSLLATLRILPAMLLLAMWRRVQCVQRAGVAQRHDLLSHSLRQRCGACAMAYSLTYVALTAPAQDLIDADAFCHSEVRMQGDSASLAPVPMRPANNVLVNHIAGQACATSSTSACTRSSTRCAGSMMLLDSTPSSCLEAAVAERFVVSCCCRAVWGSLCGTCWRA